MNFDYPLIFNALKFMAIIARISAFMLAMPMINQTQIPAKGKIFFTLLLAVLLMPVIPDNWINPFFSGKMNLLSLTLLFISELFLGLSIALALHISKEIFAMAGHIMDRNAGFTLAGAFNPDIKGQLTPFAGLLMNVFILSLLIFDAHHDILRYLAVSFKELPPGEFLLSITTFKAIIGYSAKIFTIGLQIGMPLVCTVILLNTGIALMSRIGQEFQVLMLSFPLRMVFSFMIIAAIFPALLSICRSISEQMFDLINTILIYG